MYCFHALFVLGYVLDILILVYAPRVNLIEVKIKLRFTSFSLWTKYHFLIESIHPFYFVNNVVFYKDPLVWEKSGKHVYKIFIVKILSTHLSTTWKFWPKRSWTGISCHLLASPTWLPQVGDKAQRWENFRTQFTLNYCLTQLFLTLTCICVYT